MKLLRKIGLNVILLGLVSFLNDISSEMILAILPMFIFSLGGAGLAVGLIGGVGDGLDAIVKVFSGFWTAKVGRRKPLVASGYLTSAISKFFFPLCTHWTQLIIFRPLERVGKGLRTPPRDAIIAGSVSEKFRGRAFGFHRAADTAGAFLGVLLALLLYFCWEMEFKYILLIAALVAFLALLPLIPVRDKRSTPQPGLTLKIGIKALPGPFKKYLLATFLFALGNFTYMFFVLKAFSTFESVFPARPATIPLILYLWFNLIYAGFSFPAGVLSDRYGRKKILFIGYLIYSLTCLLFAFFLSLPLAVLVFALYGMARALIDGNQRALAADLVPESQREIALGTFHSLTSLALIPAGVIAGILWNLSPGFSFIYGTLMAAIASGFLLWSVPRQNR